MISNNVGYTDREAVMKESKRIRSQVYISPGTLKVIDRLVTTIASAIDTRNPMEIPDTEKF